MTDIPKYIVEEQAFIDLADALSKIEYKKVYPIIDALMAKAVVASDGKSRIVDEVTLNNGLLALGDEKYCDVFAVIAQLKQKSKPHIDAKVEDKA